ncbi:hypothetical protein O181_047276 [Austropuccinia psidii MF-1]|uniref:Uncharacterized protein n=1 Tax=Austropuccinia psidii MF-1 TaxID=1389203 RepID=A0A9Q3DVS3_9BASI|nr:hypothetical protein [Austropuccinia psidii MF-1]
MVGNIPKPLGGGYELLLTHQKLSGSEKDHRAFRRLQSILLQRKGQKGKDLVEERKYFMSRPRETTGNHPSIGERRTSSRKQLQNYPKTIQKGLRRRIEVPRTIKKRGKENATGTDLINKVTVFPDWSLHPWKVCSTLPGLLWSSQSENMK